ncbi:energy transducer TonB [Pseudoxanthomonas sp.]|uniref:energy transducer TonB n=1 Tax=Pseudoxanthomonas sp. TaxID=1871049 RepID=UPI00258AF9C8|nr:energy transducer TonB [Pseudoxanthomonas sp.]MCR6687550.1 energy transducer TonB [Pseudoxanthomonas sp.]
MAIQTTPHPGTPQPAPYDQRDVSIEPRRTSPVLLGALVVALVALGVWWYQQRDTTADTSLATNPPTVIIEEAPPAPVASREAATPRQERARPAIADRSARPLADNPVPAYPRDALRSGSEGRVVVSIEVGADGTPTDVSVVERSGDRALDRAALQAARQWRFEPAIRDGKAVAATVRLPVDFRRG